MYYRLMLRGLQRFILAGPKSRMAPRPSNIPIKDMFARRLHFKVILEGPGNVGALLIIMGFIVVNLDHLGFRIGPL